MALAQSYVLKFQFSSKSNLVLLGFLDVLELSNNVAIIVTEILYARYTFQLYVHCCAYVSCQNELITNVYIGPMKMVNCINDLHLLCRGKLDAP